MDIDKLEVLDENIESKSREELGNILKEGRESKGFDINTIANKFKIKDQIISDIEEGAILKNEDKQYNRMIVIKYLKVLDIYNNDNIELLNSIYPDQMQQYTKVLDHEKKDVNFNAEIKNRKKISNFKDKLIMTILMIVFVVIIIGLVLFLKNNIMIAKEEVVNPTTIIENKVLEPKEVIKKKEQIEVIKEKQNGNIIDYLVKVTNVSEPIKLKITANGKTYVDIKDKDTLAQIGGGNVIDTEGVVETTIEKPQNIIINFGAIQNAKIFVNEVEVNLQELNLSGQNFVNIKFEEVK